MRSRLPNTIVGFAAFMPMGMAFGMIFAEEGAKGGALSQQRKAGRQRGTGRQQETNWQRDPGLAAESGPAAGP